METAAETGDGLQACLAALKSTALRERVRQTAFSLEEQVMPVFLALLPASLCALRTSSWGDCSNMMGYKGGVSVNIRRGRCFTRGFCMRCTTFVRHISIRLLFGLRSDSS